MYLPSQTFFSKFRRLGKCRITSCQNRTEQHARKEYTGRYVTSKVSMNNSISCATMIFDSFGLSKLTRNRTYTAWRTIGRNVFLKLLSPMGLHSSWCTSPTASGTFQKCLTKYHDRSEATECTLLLLAPGPVGFVKKYKEEVSFHRSQQAASDCTEPLPSMALK